MGAFDELKEWFSLKDAAAYVSDKRGTRIKNTELLELATEELITLHYNLVNQNAAALPNAGKWEPVYNKFSPDYPQSKELEKDYILHGKYRILLTTDFVAGLRNYCNSPHRQNVGLLFVAHDVTGRIYILCRESDCGGLERFIHFSSDQVVISKSHLDDLITKLNRCESPSPSLSGYISPYIECMLRAIKENHITKENQPKHETLKQWFLDNAPAELGVTANKATSMATLIRMPEAATGGNKKLK